MEKLPDWAGTILPSGRRWTVLDHRTTRYLADTVCVDIPFGAQEAPLRAPLKNGATPARNEVNSALALNRWIPLALGSVILILLVVAAGAYRAVLVSNESERWVSHTHEVLEYLGELQRALEGIE